MLTSWSDVQRQVCLTCVDGDGHGSCRLPVDVDCALRSCFDVARRAILAGRGRPDQRESAQEAVCVACGLRSADGTCWKRNRLECACDRFLPQIIEIMEGHPAGMA